MKKQIDLVGIGTGNPNTMTPEARQAILDSPCLIGASRMLTSLGDLTEGKELHSLITGEEICAFLQKDCKASRAAVILSGDVGFYSGAKKLCGLLSPEEFEVRSICGISSLVYFCSRLNMSWDDVAVLSAHGRKAGVLQAVRTNPRVFLLSGGEGGRADQICGQLADHGLGHVSVHVGERLSYPEERIVSGRAEELASLQFDNLSVLLVENPHPISGRSRACGLADEEFIRGQVPMTKREIRAVALSILAPLEGDVCWDVGAGTGSVSVEMALLCPNGKVYAVERKEEAVELIGQNRDQFGLVNLEIQSGQAPEALEPLPAPDRVFIGGSGKHMEAILRLILEKNPKAVVVITAIALETAAEGIKLMEALGFSSVDAVSISTARSKKAGPYHMMMGQNPVTIISGRGNGISSSPENRMVSDGENGERI